MTTVLSNVIKNPDIYQKITEELNRFCKDNDGKPLHEALNLNTLADLNYVSWCVSEGLRIEPPIPVSSTQQVTETIRVGDYTLRDGDVLAVDMNRLHYNKEEWIEPSAYIPERFDPKSRYYLTPSGQKRHPMSYGPFLGGKRICVGKTFAELIAKFVVASFVHKFPNLEFCDKANYSALSRYNTSNEVMV
eukprot:CAMPEP_0170567622 /NCGR_PEP_ID=MMETSP0211-20121228/80596_1 /TAXON_ID=311385 /ORGANISM="Pseudokeronopsis sp., Strain OXSARD2" /LENGTH=189 /DNA_ID=CAMNT_0010889127 /DNA_START=560 /DNA_END=1125 /DNA_ORIENTATION=+